MKSGYKILCEDQLVGGLEIDAIVAQRKFWKSVWKLKVPGKIKHFLWKSCTNSSPTKENLRKRTIIQQNVCHLCSDHPEDVKHALWGCSKVSQVWQRRFGWLVNTQDKEGSFSDLVLSVQKNHRLFPLFAVTAWSVWHHRNKSRLQFATVPLDRVADFAENYLQNFTDRFDQQGLPVKNAATAASWCPPYENQVKINFDGTLFGESNSGGIGVVILNSKGRVLATLSEKILKPQSAELVEILAVRRAVLFSTEMGLFNSVFEGDSSNVIKSLQDRNMAHSLGGHILKDILSYQNSFQSCSFSYIGRQGNVVAHALAQRARLSCPLEVWLESVPLDISSFVQSDLRV